MVHNMKTVLAVCLQYTQCVIDILYKLKLNLKEKKIMQDALIQPNWSQKR